MNRARIPDWARPFYKSLDDSHIYHSMDLLFSQRQGNIISSECGRDLGRLLIIGGGLTSAHLAYLAYSKFKCIRITQLIRSMLRVKHFDVNLDWVGRYKNVEFSKFYQQSGDERLDTVQKARNGGSITPHMRTQLQSLQDVGVLDLKEYTAVTQLIQQLDGNGKHVCWLVETINSKTGKSLQLEIDTIWLATGSLMDINTDPLFSNIVNQYPIESHRGIPELRHDLSWSKQLPNLYVMGAYAALQLGPNALNLIGGKSGADRISETLKQELLSDLNCNQTDEIVEQQQVFGDACNFYSLLDNFVVS